MSKTDHSCLFPVCWKWAVSKHRGKPGETISKMHKGNSDIVKSLQKSHPWRLPAGAKFFKVFRSCKTQVLSGLSQNTYLHLQAPTCFINLVSLVCMHSDMLENYPQT